MQAQDKAQMIEQKRKSEMLWLNKDKETHLRREEELQRLQEEATYGKQMKEKQECEASEAQEDE